MNQMQLGLNSNSEKAHRFNIPATLTKQLKFAQAGDKRKIRVSSNFLRMYGFEPGKRIVTRPIENGIAVNFDALGPQKIYERSYNRRANAPCEAVLELSSNEIMSRFPAYMSRYHVTMRHNELVLKGLIDKAFSVRSALRSLSNPATLFGALTSGVDLHSAQALGFKLSGCLEYRPQEARDKTDKTETGCLTVAANTNIGTVFNEDIYTFDWRRATELMDVPHIAVMSASLQCDSYSRLAPKKTREFSLDTTRDMFVNLLQGVRELEPAILTLEQVDGFAGTAEFEIMNLQMQRMGYHVVSKVMDARDYGGYTSRKRLYGVYSLFPGFKMPSPTPRRETPIWSEVIAPRLNECREVTHANSIKKGAECGRLRTVTSEKTYSNTPVKSQSRGCKDSLTVSQNGRIYMPSEAMLKDLLSIPQDFNTEVVSSEVGVEIIGQSIEYGLHHQIMGAVKDHLLENVGHCTVSQFHK